MTIKKRLMTIAGFGIRRSRFIGLHDLSVVARSLSQIMAAGYSPAAALDLLLKQSTDKKITDALAPVAADIRSGTPFAQAFEKQEKLFGHLFCRLIALGGSPGRYGPLFAKLAEYYEKNDLFIRKMRRRILHPSLMLTGAIGCIVALLLFLLFNAASGASLNAGEIPGATRIVLNIAASLCAHSGVAVLFSAALILLLAGLLFTALPYYWFDRLSWRVPFFGDLSRKNHLRRFSFTCGFLLSAGINLFAALRIAAAESKNFPLSTSIVHLTEKGRDDLSLLAGELKALNMFPPIVVDMVQEAKSPSDCGHLFEKIGEFYQEELEAVTLAVTLIIEPVAVMILGLLSAGVLIALYLPIIRNP